MIGIHRPGFPRKRLALISLLALLLSLMAGLTRLGAQPQTATTPPIAQGQKVVMATHSFNVFIGPNRRAQGDAGPLARLAAETGKAGHEMLAVQMIGGSTPMQHWNQGRGDDTQNIAKVALKNGGVDVFTMSPNARMPEEGIDLFGDLVRETNPNARILVQASWSAWDGQGTTGSVGGTGAPSFTNADHNKATVEQLQAWRNPEARYRVALRTQLAGINTRAGKPMAYVVPSADAVYTLREHIIRGEVPGVTEQQAIFADAMGHPRTPIVNLVTYVWFTAMYRQTPVGLKALVDAADATSAARELMLQQIAWNAVIAEPMSGVRGQTVAVALAAAQTSARATLPYDHIHLIEPAEEASKWWETNIPGGRRITESPNRIMYGSTRLMFLGGTRQGGSDGSVIEHLGFSVPNVDAKVKELLAAGAKVIEPARDVPSLYRTALLENQWGTRIQLVQDADLQGLHHVQLRAPDPEAAFTWLLDTFGGERVKIKGQLDSVRYAGVPGFSTVYILVARGDSVPSQGRVIDHIGWRSTASVEETKTMLEGKGVQLTTQPRPLTLPNGPPINFFYVAGPNGARIELVERPGLKPGE